MARRFVQEDDGENDNSWGDEYDEPSEEEGEPTVECPYCGRPIYEDAERCPYCEKYVSEEDAPPKRKPWWVIIGVLLCLFILLYWIVGAL